MSESRDNRRWKITRIAVLCSAALLFFVFGLFSLDTKLMLMPSIEDQLADFVNDSVDTLNDSVDTQLASMLKGNIAFNVPKQINIAEHKKIKLSLSLTETVEELSASIETLGERFGTTISVSDTMQAHLSGSTFQITVIGSEVQAVSKTQRTEWEWEVHPTEAGSQTLYLTLSAILNTNGIVAPRTIKTFEKELAVNVTASQQIKSYWDKYWAWLSPIPIIGWLWVRARKKLNNRRSTGQ